MKIYFQRYMALHILFLLFNICNGQENYSSRLIGVNNTNNEDYKKTVLLTGAAGFIGSNFLKYMFDKYPEYYFLVLDALTYAGNLENIPEYIKSSPRFEFWHNSVTNKEIVEKLMKRSNFVVHFAAESHVTRSIANHAIFFETDVMGTHTMMNALLESPKVERFIHISTSEVYGTAEEEPMKETHPLNPRSPYAAAKAGADRLVYSFWCTYDLPVLIIRPFNNYGPHQHLEKAIPRFITNALKKEPLTIHGDGSAKRDWVHVEDHCIALDKALHLEDFSKIKNKIFNIGSGVAVSVLEIAKIILKYCNLSEHYLKYIGDRPGQVLCHIAAIDEARKVLNWEPKANLEQKIKELVEWYKNNEKCWKHQENHAAIAIYTNNKILELH